MEKLSKFIGRLFLIILSISTLRGTYYENKVKLLRDLLDKDHYDSRVIPVISANKTLNVSIDIAIGDYIEIHEDTQTMKIDLWLSVCWKDDLLNWNSSEYDGISRIKMDTTQVWYPELTFSFASEHLLSNIIDPRTPLFLADDGYANMYVVRDVNFRCFMHVSKFPFDTQDCSFFIVDRNALAYQSLQLVNSSLNNIAMGEGQWDIISLTSACEYKLGSSYLQITFSVRRRPSYYVIYVMLPIIATTQLNPVVFLIPPESGEKVSTAVTILLSYSMFLNVIGGVMPSTSTSISMLSVYIAFSQLLSGTYVFICALIVRKHYAKETSSYWKIIRFWKNNSVTEVQNDDKDNLKQFIKEAEKLDRTFAIIFFGLISISTMSLVIYLLS